MRHSHRFKPLGTPKPVVVRLGEQGNPLHIRVPGKPGQNVTSIREHWRIDDEWWRQTISREYMTGVLNNEKVLTLYHDLLTNKWYTQNS